MNAYVQKVIDNVRKKYAAEPEFVQTVEEVFSSLAPVIDANPAYEKADILSRMAEPERMFTFRVCWTDDKGVNKAVDAVSNAYQKHQQNS